MFNIKNKINKYCFLNNKKIIILLKHISRGKPRVLQLGKFQWKNDECESL